MLRSDVVMLWSLFLPLVCSSEVSLDCLWLVCGLFVACLWLAGDIT